MLRKKVFLVILLAIANLQVIFAQESLNIDRSVTIIGGGIVGLFEAYHEYLDARAKGEEVQIVVLEKNATLLETPGYNLVPSLTPDEIMAVVPRGSQLVTCLEEKFNEGRGIRVDDVEGIDPTTEVIRRFISSVEAYGKNEEAHQERTKTLLTLGKYSMELWHDFYETADDELKEILRSSSYNPCLEVASHENKLHKGYRIDLIFDDPEAVSKAQSMKSSYHDLGYYSSRLLSPEEVVLIDPELKDFVYENSFLDDSGALCWTEGATALWRPGGSINSGLFIPKFVAYLEKKLTDNGSKKHLFEIFYDANVIGVEYEDSDHLTAVKAINSDGDVRLFPGIENEIPKEFIFAPGEGVGTLTKLGFHEPDYALFAGPSLQLFIDVSEDKIEHYQNLDCCMEVHQEGIVLAWQAKYRNSQAFLGVAGTKAFYGDKKPQLNEEFARDRHLLQLNVLNKVYWDLVSMALQRDTFGESLTFDDLDFLIDKGCAKVWVGSRAVAYDGFPTFGALYRDSTKIDNARVTTHLGSGGVSFVFGAIKMSRLCSGGNERVDRSIVPLLPNLLDFSSSTR